MMKPIVVHGRDRKVAINPEHIVCVTPVLEDDGSPKGANSFIALSTKSTYYIIETFERVMEMWLNALAETSR
jgi:hypothetical protein